MNKSELIRKVATEENITLKSAERVLNCITDSIKESVLTDGDFRIIGFGSFKSVVRKARTCRNPSSGESIEVPEKTVVKFKPYF